MKSLLLPRAAMMVLSLGVGSAHAASSMSGRAANQSPLSAVALPVTPDLAAPITVTAH